jgi:hypothetical protein
MPLFATLIGPLRTAALSPETIARMATLEQKTTAKEMMEAARAALVAYANKSSDAGADDPALHRKLTEDLRTATEEFLAVMKQSTEC